MGVHRDHADEVFILYHGDYRLRLIMSTDNSDQQRSSLDSHILLTCSTTFVCFSTFDLFCSFFVTLNAFINRVTQFNSFWVREYQIYITIQSYICRKICRLKTIFCFFDRLLNDVTK